MLVGGGIPAIYAAMSKTAGFDAVIRLVCIGFLFEIRKQINL